MKQLGAEGIRLYETQKEQELYLALSYAWGGTKPPMTFKANREKYEACIKWTDLPVLYQDVVILTNRLGFQYLWIDSLCIVQDDAAEKDQQIASMGSIYNNAFLVIIAAASASPYSHLLGSTTWYRWREVVYLAGRSSPVPLLLRVRDSHIGGEITCRPLSFRAWTFQERFMARRCVIFREEEVVWECLAGLECECKGDKGYLVSWPPGILVDSRLIRAIESPVQAGQVPWEGSTTHRTFRSIWEDSVREYSGRSLTFASDRLPAIAALASAIHSATGTPYYAGLWGQDLLQGLLWQAEGHNREDITSAIDLATAAPSWSWASYPGKVTYGELRQLIKRGLGEYAATVKDVHCDTPPNNLYGAAKNGRVTVEGVVTKASMTVTWIDGRINISIRLYAGPKLSYFGLADWCDYLPFESHTVTCEVNRVNTLQKCADVHQRMRDCSGQVHLLWIYDTCFLILAPTQKVSNCFQRLGIVYLHPGARHYQGTPHPGLDRLPVDLQRQSPSTATIV